MCLPAVSQQILSVRGHTQRFVSPIRQTKQRANTQPTKARIISALRCFESPIKVFLRPGGVHVVVERAIISFLIDDQSIRASGDHWTILVGFHRPDFERHAGNLLVQCRDTFCHVTIGNKLRMLTRNEQDVAKTLRRQCARLASNFIHRESDAQNRVVAGEAAILAIVDALVGKVERREESDDFAEALLRDLLGTAAEWFEKFSCCGRDELGEISEREFVLGQQLAGVGAVRFERTLHECFERQGIEFGDKTHTSNLSNHSGKSRLRVALTIFFFAMPARFILCA